LFAPPLTGQLCDASALISAQQCILGSVARANRSGRVGLKEPIPRTKIANRSLAGMRSYSSTIRHTAPLVVSIRPDARPNRDFDFRGDRADRSAISCFSADLHRLRLTGAEILQAGLLREQDLLRDFAKEQCPGFTAIRKKLHRLRVERDLRRVPQPSCATLHFVRSTTFFSRDLARASCAAALGSLYVSHLIRRL